MFLEHLEESLANAMAYANQLWIATALLSDGGLAYLRKHWPEGATGQLLVGVDLPTPPSALAALLQWSASGAVSVRIYAGDAADTYFHPKVYITQGVAGRQAFVGSANCTTGGLSRNVELSVANQDNAAVERLQIEWFGKRWGEAVPLTEAFLKAYEEKFAARREAEAAARAARNLMREFVQAQLPQPGQHDLGGSLANQYFKPAHYQAFWDHKPTQEDGATNEERRAVANRMHRLHKQLEPLVAQKRWDLQPHPWPEHVISAWKHGVGVESELRAIWLNYGRSKAEIKGYGSDNTPKNFIRLQVIIFSNHLATWCRIGKQGTIDRRYFKEKMRTPGAPQAYFELIQSLGSEFFVRVKDAERNATDFADADDLSKFVAQDKDGYYFVVGRKYLPAAAAISEAALPATVMTDWTKLYEVYRWMKCPSLTGI